MAEEATQNGEAGAQQAPVKMNVLAQFVRDLSLFCRF